MTNEKRKEYAKVANERLGETRINNLGSAMTIIQYINSNSVIVQFVKSGYITSTTYNSFLTGSVKCPYDRSVYGIGYIGIGRYKITDEDGKQTGAYSTWRRMLERSYSAKYHERKPTYKDVEVCEEWHDFQNFAEWYEDNYYEIECQQMHLDKDIIVKGNRVYSPETCVFAPEKINALFRHSKKNKGLPIGVHYIEAMKKYKASCSFGDGRFLTQLCDNPYDAFDCYKIFKEKRIKEVAEEFKGRIPKKLYEAMITYKVEITD